MKQKQVTNHVQKLGQQYSQYLRLLASDTQVTWGGLPADLGSSLEASAPCSLHPTRYRLHPRPSAPRSSGTPAPRTSVRASVLSGNRGQPHSSPDQLSLQVAPCLPREYWESLGSLETPAQQPWSVPVLLQLGKQLAELLVQAVQMPRSLAARHGAQNFIPVLYHVYSFRSYRQVRLHGAGAWVGPSAKEDWCAVLWVSEHAGQRYSAAPVRFGMFVKSRRGSLV